MIELRLRRSARTLLGLLLRLGAICCFLWVPVVVYLGIASGGAPGTWGWMTFGLALFLAIGGLGLFYAPKFLPDHPRFVPPAAILAALAVAGVAVLAARHPVFIAGSLRLLLKLALLRD